MYMSRLKLNSVTLSAPQNGVFSSALYRVYHSSFNSIGEAGRDVGDMMETEADRCSHT